MVSKPFMSILYMSRSGTATAAYRDYSGCQ
jgi:hypothetical protein